MPEPKPSFLRRLANFGPLGLFQRARNLLLRPARHELADARREIAGQREEASPCARSWRLCAGPRPTWACEMDALREQSRQELEAQMTPPRQAIQQLATAAALLEGMLVSGLDARGRRFPAQPRRWSASCCRRATAPPASSTPSRACWRRATRIGNCWSSTTAAKTTPPPCSPATTIRDLRSFAIAHAGCSAARNHALRQSRGELIAYLDSDNTWFPAFLSAAVAAFERIPRWSWPTGCSPRKRTHRAN
jgi:hypothetical protein